MSTISSTAELSAPVDEAGKEKSAGSFTRSVATLLGGTAGGQLVLLAASPFLSRLYLPEDFGTFALFTAVTSLVSVISTGRYERAVVVADTEEEALNVAALSLALAFATTALTSLTLFLLIAWGKLDVPPAYLLLVPLSVLATGILQVLSNWSNRRRNYPALAVSRLLQGGSAVAVMLGAGVPGAGGTGLMAGTVAGQLVGMLWLLRFRETTLFSVVSRRGIAAAAGKHRDFPLVNSLQAFTDSLQANAVIFLLGAFFGASVVGSFAFTTRVLRTPLSLVGNAVSQVFFERASSISRAGGDLRGLVRKVVPLLALTAAIPCLLVTVWGPSIFSLFFGAEWGVAGQYARLLAPWIFFTFLASPLTQIPLIVRRQKSLFLASLCGNGLIVMSVVAGHHAGGGPEPGFLFLSASLSAYFLLLIAWIVGITPGSRECRAS